MVTAHGEVLVLSRDRDPDRFPGAAVHLGALGVVTKVTLDVQPTFQVAQVVYENLDMDQLSATWMKFLPAATASACSPTGRITVSARCG